MPEYNQQDTMYSELVSSYQQTFNSFVGPCEVLVSGETLPEHMMAKENWISVWRYGLCIKPCFMRLRMLQFSGYVV